MSVQVENLEGNMAKLTVEVPAEELEKAIQNVYMRQRKNISIPGFRKGKVPRIMVERMYGAGVFYEDAANDLIPRAWQDAAEESKLDIVSRPKIEVTQIEKGKPFIFTAEVATRPDVVLGQYKGIEVDKSDVTVTDEDVDKALKNEQEKNARTVTVEDRPAEKGDTVVLDYAGTIDGVAFDGGTANEQKLELGSNTFIPGFEDQLVGVNAGEEKDVHVTFPEDYHADDLKGKEAVFHCTIHKIQKKELPELDDDFASDVSEFDTLEEYKADLRKNLEERKQAAAKQDRRDHAVSQAAQNSTIDIPDAMIDTQAEQMVDNFANQLQQQGLSIDQYIQYTGQNVEALKNSMKPQAEQQIRTRLTLEKVADTEGVEVSDEEVDKEIEDMAKSYNIELDKMKKIIGDAEREDIRSDLKVRKAIDLIADAAVEVEKAEDDSDKDSEKTE